MPFTSPTALVELITKTDKRTANLLLAGLAVCASAAVIASMKIDIMTMAGVALVLISLGALAFCIAQLIRTPAVQRAVGGLALLLFASTSGVLAFSSLTGGMGVFPPVYCLLKFWEPCVDVEQVVVDRNKSSLTRNVEVKLANPAEFRVAVQRSSFKVYLQFAGMITRDNMRSLTTALRGTGWAVQGDNGDRQASAAGLSEVRYGRDSDRAAAEALAAEVSSSRLSSSPLKVKKLTIIPEGKLEVWFSN